MKKSSIVLILMAVAASAQANVTLHGLFTDHMVLQRDMPLAVYGKADPGEKVTVSFAGQTRSATADQEGKWALALDAMKACAHPAAMTVEGRNKLTLDDIVVGDVWVCSGQSNMDFTPGAYDGPYDVKDFDVPLLRQFQVANVQSVRPESEVKGNAQMCKNGWWMRCSRETGNHFTAVGLYFGRKLQLETGIPIGLIKASWNASAIQPWIPVEAMASVPELASERMKAAEKAGEPIVREDLSRYSSMYNGMIHPLIHFPIKGVIWYQGEANAGDADNYYPMMRAMVGGWRKAWNQGDFPFYYVQLAAFQRPNPEPAGGDGWAKFRAVQLKCLTIPNSGMAVAIDLADIGRPDDIHPKDKKSVGERLALWALAKDYGRKDLVYSGPLYEGMKIEDGKIRIFFDGVGSGLKIATRKGGFQPLVDEPGGKLRRFAIAGADKKWVWADAVIDGATVVVSSPDVPKPVTVRYAYSMCPEGCNLYNQEGLPASPFRTDKW